LILDDKGKVVKSNDHLMDCTRYLVKTGLSVAKPVPVERDSSRRIRNWRTA
jgi:hypothetical protein